VSQAAELFPLGDPPNYEPNPDDKLGARAAQMGVDVKELIYDLMLERNGEALFLLPASNFVGASLEPVRRMLEHPQTLVALGDGGAHYGTICDSSYPTFVLAYWTRDRTLGKKLPLPWAIRALSHANTEAIGIKDRGLVAPGLLADLNVIDYDALQLRAPQMVHNLPAGGGRLTQQAEGYVATIKSGVITYRNGQPTGQLPGRLLRNPVVAP
jgi:N-acyl-D-aspartate/D-glutamate deacylase